MVGGHFLPEVQKSGPRAKDLVQSQEHKELCLGHPTSVPTAKASLALSIPEAEMALFTEIMNVPEQTNMEVNSLSCKDE